MCKLQITMFEAGNGDSFLIKCVGEETTNILVDFGYSSTYKRYVENHLIDMAGKNEKLNLVIVTHIDQDHISGGIRFFENNGFADNPKIISVGDVWHNSYRHLEMAETDKLLTEKERKHIAVKSIIVEQNRSDGVNDTSAKQGSRLAVNLHNYGYHWNSCFGGKAVFNNEEKPIHFNDEIKITVLSPTMKQLEKLKKVWKDELKDRFPTIKMNNEIIFDDAIECITLMRRPNIASNCIRDTSTTTNLEILANTIFQEDIDEINASSITCIIEFMDKKILLLGDSVSSIIESQIKKIYKETDFPIIFDAIKVAHHGSSKNTRKELLNIIDSEHFFISTNGKVHGHPDIETIAKIVIRENRGFIRNIYFTNQLSSLNIFESKELQQKYQYKTHYRSADENGLQVYL